MVVLSPLRKGLEGTIIASLWIARGSADSTCENEVWAKINANKNNLTALQTISSDPWVSSSEFRGTMSILQSCILTLVACIYTALHLNVPVRKGWQHMLINKAKWVVLALLAPEIVLYMAADQLTQAARLKKQLRALQDKSHVVDKSFEFDLKYCFFVVMGGLRVRRDLLEDMISTDDIYYSYEQIIKERMADPSASFMITPQGVLELAQRDYWIYIAKTRIDDKSKADILQKALVIFQVTWMATQCIARRIYGLPLTLLEIHTMVHVVCAIALYAFWFKKPLDIREPEFVSDDDWKDTLAVMIQKSFHRENSRNYMYSTDEAVLKDPNDIQAEGFSWTRVASTSIWCRSDRTKREERSRNSLARLDRLNRVLALAPKPAHGFRNTDAMVRLDVMLQCSYNEKARNCVCLSLSNANLSFSAKFAGYNLEDVWEFITDAPGLCALGLFLPIVYGGIHLTAWNFEFPTSIELLLWKIACIDIGLTLIFLAAFAFFGFIIGILLFGLLEKLNFAINLPDPVDVTDYLFRGAGCIAVMVYTCSRIYIVAESFISLRQVPIGVYWTPAWLQMIPHF